METIKKIMLFVLLAASSDSVFSIDASEKIKVTPILKTLNSWDGKKIVYPEGTAEVTGMIIEMAPGGETGWHLHPVPSFGFVLEGELEVLFKNGDVKHLSTGQSAAEAVNVLHNGRNVGEVPLKLVVFYMGTTDKQLTIKEGEE